MTTPADQIHHAAASGFQAGAEAYDRGRPGYPEEAVAYLVDALRIGSSSTVLDLGAAAENGEADAVVVAAAFHWFDGDVALAEIHRVLCPTGRLGVVWNVRDESVDWMARLTDIIDVYAGDTPRFRTGAWRGAFERTRLFERLRLLIEHPDLSGKDEIVFPYRTDVFWCERL